MKDILKRSFLGTYLIRRWRAMKYRKQSREMVFADIHRRNAWGSSESVSGPGSELAQTQAVRAALPELLHRLGVEVFLDASCGDFHWMKEVELGTIRYIGADIVPELVADNQNRHGRPGRSFVVRDITSDALPAADFVMCRDCLMHLGYEEINAALRHLCDTGAKHLLITTFAGTRRNADIGHGGWWPMNLQLPPFNLSAPLELFAENPNDPEARSLRKSMGLWSRDAVLRVVGGRA